MRTDPKSLFRYRTLSAYSLGELVNQTMWYAKPTKFNDPFDCALTIDQRRFSESVRHAIRVGMTRGQIPENLPEALKLRQKTSAHCFWLSGNGFAAPRITSVSVASANVQRTSSCGRTTQITIAAFASNIPGRRELCLLKNLRLLSIQTECPASRLLIFLPKNQQQQSRHCGEQKRLAGGTKESGEPWLQKGTRAIRRAHPSYP